MPGFASPSFERLCYFRWSGDLDHDKTYDFRPMTLRHQVSLGLLFFRVKALSRKKFQNTIQDFPTLMFSNDLLIYFWNPRYLLFLVLLNHQVFPTHMPALPGSSAAPHCALAKYSQLQIAPAQAPTRSHIPYM